MQGRWDGLHYTPGCHSQEFVHVCLASEAYPNGKLLYHCCRQVGRSQDLSDGSKACNPETLLRDQLHEDPRRGGGEYFVP